MKRISLLTICIFVIIACNHLTYTQGKALYESNCAQCHMPDGTGVGDLYPALNELGNQYDYSIISCYIINGKKSEESLIEMVPIKGLSDIEISNIINYVHTEINGMDGEIAIKDIRAKISTCRTD